MLIAKGAAHGLAPRSDACATAGAGAADAVLVLVATSSLPTALGATAAVAAGLPSLGARARRTSGPTARLLGPTGVVPAIPAATPLRPRATPSHGAGRAQGPEASTAGLVGPKARLPRASTRRHPTIPAPRVPPSAVEARLRTRAVPVRQGVRLASAEVVVAGTVATMASTTRTVRGLVETPTLGAIGAWRLLVAMAIALQGVQVPTSYPSALDTRGGRTVVRATPTRASPATARAKLVGRVVEVACPDVGVLPSSASSVGQEELDGRRQDEGVVPALAAVVGGAPVAVPVRPAVVALVAARVGRLAIPRPGAEALGAPTSVPTKASTLTLALH